MSKLSSLLRGLACLLIGTAASLALAIQFFEFYSRPPLDRLFLTAIPALSFALLLWISLPPILAHFSKPVLMSGLAASLPALLLLALIQRAYPLGWQQMFLAAALAAGLGSAMLLARDGLRRGARQFLRLPVLIPAILLLAFDAGVILLTAQFPFLFQPQQFLPPLSNLPWIGIGLLTGVLALGPFAGRAGRALGEARLAALGAWLEENLPGLWAAAAVFLASFLLAHGFNPPVDGLSLNNTFFASDTFFWQVRYGTPGWYPLDRAVHPFALLLLRAASSALAFLLNGDWRLAALTLTALTAAACVFLAWRFVLRVSRRASYALTFSGLLGLSAAHLVFGSVTETYIFSAFGLLLFFVLLLAPERPLREFILPGLLTLGITITNVVQSLIGFALVRRDARQWRRLVSLLLAAGAALTILTAVVYPYSVRLFFVPSELLLENQHTAHLGRGTLLPARFAQVTKSLLFYDVVAVPPSVTVVNKEGRPPFPKFNYLQPPLGLKEYLSNRFGLPPFLLWSLLLAWAAARFVWRGRRSPYFSFQLSLLAILAFNLGMHLFYGFEPFLYTPNWTYALLFFVALSLDGMKRQEWADWALILLLALLVVNNSLFLRALANHLAPFFPPG